MPCALPAPAPAPAPERSPASPAVPDLGRGSGSGSGSSRLLPVALLVLLAAACGPPPPPPLIPMERFNAGLCPRPLPEDTSRPLDPNLEGVHADLTLPQKVVQPAARLRLVLTLRNGGVHNTSLALPQSAFTLEGFQLVDHTCRPVTYIRPVAARALGYRDTGPMPLRAGESATLESTLDGLAPGLDLRRGIYAIRLALHVDPATPELRGRTLYSDWATFAVTGYQ